MSLSDQLKAWRERWEPTKPEDQELSKAFAIALGNVHGKVVIDYLIETYFKPLEFIGAADPLRLAERNGQQLMMVDILTRYDKGLHPTLFEEPPASPEPPFDARM